MVFSVYWKLVNNSREDDALGIVKFSDFTVDDAQFFWLLMRHTRNIKTSPDIWHSIVDIPKIEYINVRIIAKNSNILCSFFSLWPLWFFFSHKNYWTSNFFRHLRSICLPHLTHMLLAFHLSAFNGCADAASFTWCGTPTQ